MADMPECCTKYADHVFVFGSNEAGVHGAGAAEHAHNKHGALFGQGYGRQGNSFGIPTKGWDIKTLPLWKVREHVSGFLAHADLAMRTESDTRFYVTAVGTGLAGFKPEQIAPMFKDAPPNCILPVGWLPWSRPNRPSEPTPP